MNPGEGGFSEPRSCHCTPAWATRAELHLKKKGKEKKESIGMLKYFQIRANTGDDGFDVEMLEMRTIEDKSFKYYK